MKQPGLCLLLVFAFIAPLARPAQARFTSSAPILAVQAKQAALISALTRGDLQGVLACYSESYRHEDGETKPDLREYQAWYFQNTIVVRIETLSERYVANRQGTLVTQTISTRLIERDRDTGEQRTVACQGIIDWVQEGIDWRIVHAQTMEDVL